MQDKDHQLPTEKKDGKANATVGVTLLYVYRRTEDFPLLLVGALVMQCIHMDKEPLQTQTFFHLEISHLG